MDHSRHFPILFLLACCPLFAQAPADPVRAGWEALDKGDLPSAARIFYDQVRAHPEDAEAHAGLGVTMTRMNCPNLAIPELRKAREMKCAYEHIDLELGRAYLRMDLYADARPPLEAYRASHPQAWKVHELLGLCCFHLGDWDGCIAAMSDPSLASHPEEEDIVLYHLGLSYRERGEIPKGDLLLAQLQEKHPDSALAQASKKYVEPVADLDVWARQRLVQPTRWWYARAGIEGGFDTNPVAIGDDALVPGSFAKEDIWKLGSYAGLGVRPVVGPDTNWTAEVRGGGLWHDELAKFDQASWSFSTYAEHWIRRWIGVSASGSWNSLWVDQDKVRDTWTAGAAVSLVEASWTRTRLAYDHANNEFYLDSLAESQDVDGTTDSVGVTQEAWVPGSQLRLAVGYSHVFQETEGDDFDADLDRVFLRASHPVVWEIQATATVAFTDGDYDHANSRDAAGRERDDDVWAGTIRLDRPVTEWMNAYVGATFIDNESNVAVFDYDRNIYAAGVEIRY